MCDPHGWVNAVNENEANDFVTRMDLGDLLEIKH